MCTGVLIAPDRVLTAGHCLASPPTRVVLDRSRLGAKGGAQFRVRSTERIEGMDLGWIHLDSPALLPPARLLPSCASARKARLVGWGTTDASGTQRSDRLMEALLQCEGAQCGAPGVDSCDGDSGAPVLTDTPFGEDFIVALALASADGQSGCGQGGVYLGAAEIRAALDLPEEDCQERQAPVVASFEEQSPPSRLDLDPRLSWRIAVPPETIPAHIDGHTLVLEEHPELRKDRLVLEAWDGHFRVQREVAIRRRLSPDGCQVSQNSAPSTILVLGLFLLLGRRGQRTPDALAVDGMR